MLIVRDPDEIVQEGFAYAQHIGIGVPPHRLPPEGTVPQNSCRNKINLIHSLRRIGCKGSFVDALRIVRPRGHHVKTDAASFAKKLMTCRYESLALIEVATELLRLRREFQFTAAQSDAYLRDVAAAIASSSPENPQQAMLLRCLAQLADGEHPENDQDGQPP